MKLSVAEILDKTILLDRPSQIEYLRRNDSFCLREMLRYAYDPRVKWALPEGKPPFKACDELDQESMLPNSMKKMYLFMEGGNPNIAQIKREKLFLDLLEAITPADAELLCAVKDKIMPYAEIDVHLVNEAFPGLLPPEAIPAPVVEKPKKVIKKKKTKE